MVLKLTPNLKDPDGVYQEILTAHEGLDAEASALTDQPDENLIFAPYFSKLVRETEPSLRKVVSVSVAHGLQVPALAAALSYFDVMRTARSTANIIQAQRDFFGAHGFERFDGRKDQHGPW